VKLANHQLIVADAGKFRPQQESRGGNPVEPISAVARTASSSSYDQGAQLPRPYMPNNVQAVNFYQYTASLDAEPGELIGIDTYA
tara:strand:- start:54577 stop:54831 length:255 start_codon:yes stop_codon:yes gene_type:complete